jgi:hypothetical protein
MMEDTLYIAQVQDTISDITEEVEQTLSPRFRVPSKPNIERIETNPMFSAFNLLEPIVECSSDSSVGITDGIPDYLMPDIIVSLQEPKEQDNITI